MHIAIDTMYCCSCIFCSKGHRARRALQLSKIMSAAKRAPWSGARRAAKLFPAVHDDDKLYYLGSGQASALHVSMVQSRALPLSVNPHWHHYVSLAFIALAITLGLTRIALLGELNSLSIRYASSHCTSRPLRPAALRCFAEFRSLA